MMTETVSVTIAHRWRDGPVFVAQVPVAIPVSKRMQHALLAARDNGANLRGASLVGANLSDSDLRGADLSDSDLCAANLSDSDLSDSDLGGADLRGASLCAANLSDSDLGGADLRGANLRGANLRGANLRGANLGDVPVVPNIDSEILAAVEDGGGHLDMSDWHRCQTTHCRAGWAIHLAGDAGYALEEQVGPYAAGVLIYAASAPHLPIPDFCATDAAALADIRKRVVAEASGSMSGGKS